MTLQRQESETIHEYIIKSYYISINYALFMYYRYIWFGAFLGVLYAKCQLQQNIILNML